MKYRSTRTQNGEAVSAAYAIKNGIAPDGGLYMPETIPALTGADITALAAMSYPERAARVLSLYLSDYTEELAKNHAIIRIEKREGTTTLVGGGFSLTNLNNTVNKYIPSEFLPK